MNEKLSKEQIEAISKALNDALSNGPWAASNFLKSIGSGLEKIRDNFEHKVRAHETQSYEEQVSQVSFNQAPIQPGQREVFVTIYSATGNNMQTWEHILNNLPRHILSRPIYSQEEDAREIIKTKANRLNEGYVSIYIEETSILPLPPEKLAIDRLGKALITLKEAMKPENINRFEHQTGSYILKNFRLVKIN